MSILEELEKEENRLVAQLRKEYDKDLEKDSNILYKMGNIYSKRGKIKTNYSDFTKAAALYNSALIRNKAGNLQTELKDCIKRNEQQLLELITGKKFSPHELPASYSEVHKKDLKEIRSNIKTQTDKIWNDIKHDYRIDMEHKQRIQKEKDLTEAIQSLFKFIKTEMETFVRNLLNKCYGILGKSPVKYAILELGSWARQELTPYSDIEFAVLVENEEEVTKQYFRNLTHLFHLFVINLGETLLPALAIKSLNDFDGKDDWFFDSVTCNGLCFDGSMPWACKTPLGRPDREVDGETKPGIELIMTPENMATLQNEDIALKEGYHLADILATVDLLDGDDSLLTIYAQAMKKETTEDRTQISKKTFLNDLETYNAKNKLLKIREKMTLSKVKSEIYRLPTLTASNLKICLRLCGNTPWEICSELASKKIVSVAASRNMEFIISLALILRLQTYLHNEGQKELMSLYSEFDETSPSEDIKRIFYLDKPDILLRLYFTQLPMIEFFRQFVNNTLDEVSPDTTIQTSTDYYEDPNTLLYMDTKINRAIIYYKLGQYDVAQKYCKEVDNFDDNVTSLRLLGYISVAQCEHQRALEYHLRCKEILEKQHTGRYKLHPEKATTFNDIGNVYHYLRNFDEALLFHRQCKNMRRKLFGKKAQLDMASALNNIGTDLISGYGKADEAQKYYLQTEDMLIELFKDAAHPHMALVLSNIGSTYLKLGDYDEALKYNLKSKNMMKQLYGNIAHFDIALSLNNTGVTYKALHNADEALNYFLQTKHMQEQLYGDRAHPDTALLLSNSGSISNVTEAQNYITQSLDMWKQLPKYTVDSRHAESLRNIGNLNTYFGEHQKALDYHLQAKDVWKQLFGDDPHSGMAESVRCIGDSYCDLGDYQKSLKYHHRAITMWKRLFEDRAHPQLAASLRNIGNTYLKLNKHDETLNYRKMYHQMQKDLCRPPIEIVDSLRLLGLAYMRTKDYEKCLECTREAYQEAEHIPDNIKCNGNNCKSFMVLLLFIDIDCYDYMEKSGEVNRAITEFMNLEKNYFSGQGDNRFEKEVSTINEIGKRHK